MKNIYLVLLAAASLFSSLWGQAPSIGSREDKGLIELKDIKEASGIDASRLNKNVLWTHNDSGDSPRIFALNSNGKHLGIFKIKGITNRDWEDIAVGPGPKENTDYIYIADIGDNEAKHSIKNIYRIAEPVVIENQKPVNITLKDADVIKFKYPDGRRDAETILIDPLTKDIYIVSKRENQVRVYIANYPQPLNNVITLKHAATLPVANIVGGDISNDGSEILLKNYDSVYYWKREPGQTITEALTNNKFYTLPYKREVQGEAICWSSDSKGFFTLSEEVKEVQARLYFYPGKTK